MLRGCSEDLLFVHHVLDDLGLFNVASVKNLNSINFVCFLIVAGINLSEISRTKLLNHMEVADYHFFLMIMP